MGEDVHYNIMYLGKQGEKATCLSMECRKTLSPGALTVVWQRPRDGIREWTSRVLGYGWTPAEQTDLVTCGVTNQAFRL